MILWYFPWAHSPHAWPLQCTHVMFLLVPHHSIFNTWQPPHYDESSSFVILTQFAHQPFHPGIAHTWVQLAGPLCNIRSHWASRLELVKWCSSFVDPYQHKLCMDVHSLYSPYNTHGFKIHRFWKVRNCFRSPHPEKLLQETWHGSSTSRYGWLRQR